MMASMTASYMYPKHGVCQFFSNLFTVDVI